MKFATDAVYVLHVFQKKAVHGIATPHREVNLVKIRYRRAEEHYTENYGNRKEKRL